MPDISDSKVVNSKATPFISFVDKPLQIAVFSALNIGSEPKTASQQSEAVTIPVCVNKGFDDGSD